MKSSVTVTPRAHWVNAWFLRPFARPVVRMDGNDHEARWGRPLRFEVAAGPHEIGVGARYRRSISVLGVAGTRIEIPPEQNVMVEARNGVLNHQPFVLRTAPSAPDRAA